MSQNAMPGRIDRRGFLAGAAAGAIAAVEPAAVRGYPANSTLELGLIGCGGRGNWIADLFLKTGKYRWAACADYFADRAETTGSRLRIEAGRRHATLSGYKRVLDGKVDAVVIESPPFFHPGHAADAVAAGKHVFLAKPIAVDVPGCTTIAESGRRAAESKRVFLVDFQTRASPLFREALRRVRAGDLGRLVLGEAHYPWSGGGRGAPPADREEKLRNWYYVLPLSGDFVVEQSIHTVDVATWIAGANPVRARGAGGRKLRPEGSIWDHFAVTYWFPDDVIVSFTAIQSIPGVRDEIRCRFFGSDGVIVADYFGDVRIDGAKPYPGGSTGDLYRTGTVTNIEEFAEAIEKGRYGNETVADSVRSNLSAILARETGYRGGEMTWDELCRANRKLEFDLSGLKA
jgi:myo-inositol 2-dehydrogenase/D-chiro-inositol 1-dehydrogenase